MFSTMITVASTISPKSMAPTESRLAESPRMTRMPMAKNSAKGIVAATIKALRTLPRKSHWKIKTKKTPITILCSTVLVVMLMSSRRS